MKPRFQFRLRTLMLLVTIVAVQCAVCLPALKEWQRMHDADAIREERLESLFRIVEGVSRRQVRMGEAKLDYRF